MKRISRLSSPRKRGSIVRWIPAFAGMTIILLISSSCANTEWGKKLAKMRTKPPRPAQFNVEASDEREYAVLYREHYQFWRGWHQELVRGLGDNRKKDMQNMREARRQLASLEKYLPEDKVKELQYFLGRFDRSTQSLLRSVISSGDMEIMSRNLESLQSQIEAKFHPKKIKDSLLSTPLPFSMNMKDYQGDEPVLPSAEVSIKPPQVPADSPKDDELTYEKFRALSAQ